MEKPVGDVLLGVADLTCYFLSQVEIYVPAYSSPIHESRQRDPLKTKYILTYLRNN